MTCRGVEGHRVSGDTTGSWFETGDFVKRNVGGRGYRGTTLRGGGGAPPFGTYFSVARCHSRERPPCSLQLQAFVLSNILEILSPLPLETRLGQHYLDLVQGRDWGA